jgi:stage III sporulation protein AB
MYIKLLGSIVIVSCACFYGRLPGKKLQSRIKLLHEFKISINRLNSQSVYEKKLLPEALYELSIRTTDPLDKFFGNVAEKLNIYDGHTIAEAWKEGIDESLTNSALTASDLDMLNELGKAFGGMDEELLQSLTKNFLKELEERIKALSCQYEEKNKLYTKLGIMGGLFLVIILL